VVFFRAAAKFPGKITRFADLLSKSANRTGTQVQVFGVGQGPLREITTCGRFANHRNLVLLTAFFPNDGTW